jgi:hypothetical protein
LRFASKRAISNSYDFCCASLGFASESISNPQEVNMDADELMSMDELEKQYKEHRRALEKQCYVDGEDIVINLADEYCVPLSRCSTPEAILGWVQHLAEKTWITVPVIERFIQLATQHHGIKTRPLPA